MTSKIQVIVRCRPLSIIEAQAQKETIYASKASNISKPKDCKKLASFQASLQRLPKFYGPDAESLLIFEENLRPLLINWFTSGENASIFTYGQTNTGKTFTMLGTKEKPGLLPLAVEEIMKLYSNSGENMRLCCSYFEIYNEKIYDLLSNKDYSNLFVNEDNNNKEFFIKGLTEKFLYDFIENENNEDFNLNKPLEKQASKNSLESTMEISLISLDQLLKQGEKRRHYNETMLKHYSSRSHTVFRLKNKDSYLDFVDLAGSERLFSMEEETKSKGLVKETKSINKSLFFLTEVIDKLGKGIGHIPYRNSPLTKILRASLMGNAKTLFILCIHPCFSEIEHTLRTLNFGNKAKNVVFENNKCEMLVEKHKEKQDEFEKLNIKLKEKEGKLKEQEKTINKLTEMVLFYQNKIEKPYNCLKLEEWKDIEKDLLELLLKEKQAEASYLTDFSSKNNSKCLEKKEIRFFNSVFYRRSLMQSPKSNFDNESTLISFADFLKMD